MFYFLCIPFKINKPILETIKVNVPNTVVKNDTLRPPAIIFEDTLSMDSMASNADIIPMIEPKKPTTNPNNPASANKPIIFFESGTSLLSDIKALIKKKTVSNKQIKIKDIKNGPPSLKRSTKGLANIKLEKVSDKKFIVNGFN